MLVFEPCPVCLERCSTAVLSCVVMRQSGNGITEERSAAQSPEILDMSAITSRLDVAHHTLRGRYKELRACALKRAQSFPWGESVDDGSLNDYLRMLVEAEESLSQGCWRRRADRTVPSVTASSSSATLALGVTDIRGECGASASILTPGQISYSGASMLPPAFLANQTRREELTTRVKAAQARLSTTLSCVTNEGPLISHSEGIECTDRDTQTGTLPADLGTGKRRRIDPQYSISVDADRLADANTTTTSSESAIGAALLPSTLDDEDLAIERQLLAGISPADIIAGSTNGRHASQHETPRSNQQRPHAAVDGRVHDLQSSRTHSRSSTPLGSADLSDDLLQPGGEFLRSEAEVAVFKRWMA